MDFDRYSLDSVTSNVWNWMYLPRIIRKQSKYGQIFIKILTQNGIRALAHYQEEFLKNIELRLA